MQAQLPRVYEKDGDGSNVDIATIAASGEKVVLQSSVQTKIAGGAFMSGYLKLTGYTDGITDENFYVFEASGKKSSDNYDTYYLKHVATGQYLQDATLPYDGEGDTSDEPIGPNGEYTWYTTDKSRAFEFVALKPTEGGEGRTGVASEKVSADPLAWVFSRAENQTTSNGSTYVFYGCYYNPFFSNYRDTNQWVVFKVKEAKPINTLMTAYNELGAFNENLYVVGTQPGQIADASIVNAMKAAGDAINEAANNENLTLEEASVLYETYKTAKEAADAARQANLPAVGKYYFIKNHRSGGGVSENGTVLTQTSGFTIPDANSEIESSIAAYIWQLEDAGNGKVYLKNFASGRYNGAPNGDSNLQSVETPSEPLGVVLNDVASQTEGALVFNFVAPNGQGFNDKNGAFVCYWGGNNTDRGNFWAVYNVDDAVIESIKSVVETNRRNQQLQTLYSNATYSLHKGMKYTGTSTNDGEFSNAMTLANTQFSTNNALDSDPIENLNDNDLTTVYHSAWGGNTPIATEDVYVQVDLGKVVEDGKFEIKIAPRRNGDNVRPIRVGILTSQDGQSWVDGGDYLLTYDIPASAEEGALMLTRLVVGGGSATRYFRFVCKTNPSMQQQQLTGGHASMCISEFHVYTGAITANEDPTVSYYLKVSDATRAEFEKQLAAAKEELSKNAATQATIDALKAAYAALLTEMPDPQELLDAVDAARAAVTNLPIGNEIGYFDEEAKTALDNTLENVEASAEEGLSREDIDAGKAEIEAALKAFMNSLILPTAGKIYALRSGTTAAANAAVRHALMASNGNSTTAALVQVRQIANENYDEEAGESESNPAKVDAITPRDDLRLLWTVTEVGNGTIVVRNLGSGYYLGNATTNAGGLPNVPAAIKHEISSSGTGGAFFLKAGTADSKDLYINFSGSNQNIIGYNVADANCAIIFEEIDLSSSGENHINKSISVSADGYTVITMPYDVMVPLEDDGMVYEVLGQTEEGDGYALALREYEDDNYVMHAGYPYLFQPSAKVAEAKTLVLQACDEDGYAIVDDGVLDLVYDFEPKTSHALVGTMDNAKITEGPIVTFTNAGGVSIPNANTLWRGVDVANNSGYVTYIKTTESGDKYITLPNEMATSISGTIVDANANADVYTLSGVKVRQNVKVINATQGLPAGIYVVGGKKVLVK